tara:strand:+ start:505 stop:2865 length:2361 start_codon:yes stop_codon:yes gene_type:complete
MASLIWEAPAAVSPGYNLKFKVKMSDGSNMIDSDEGVDLINIVNSQDFNSISLGQGGNLSYSLGLGYIDYNYDEMWSAAEEFYANVSYNANRFASLGSGMGLVSGYGFNNIPFSGNLSSVEISAIYWETTNYSCIVELQVVGEEDEWGDEVRAYTHSAQDSFLQDTGLSLNPDAQLSGHEYGLGNYGVPKEWVDDLNILVGFVFTINGDSGAKDIFPVNRSTVDSAISDGRIAYNSQTLPFAPVKFNAEGIYDYTVSILNVNVPDFIPEAQSRPILLQLKSQDYNGGIKVYLVDSESISEVNEAIGEDLLDWYGEITEDVVAQYGTLDYDGEKIISDSISVGETKDYQITYTSSSVDAGQTDNMSIFIKFDDPDFEAYGDEQVGAENQWLATPLSSHFSYTDNIEIDIVDVQEEYIEAYNPSDNLITQPADIVHHIFGEELGFDKNKIDTFSKSQSWDQHTNYEMAFSVNKRIAAKKLMQEISQSCKSIPILSEGNLKFITVKSSYNGTEEMQTIKADDVLNYSFSRTPLEDIVTKVEVKYKKDYGLDTYLKSHIVEATLPTYFHNGGVEENYREDNYYGVKEISGESKIDHINSFLDFECDYITDDNSASQLARYLLYWNLNQHTIANLTLPLNYYALQVGDLIEFDKMLLGKKVYGEKYVLGEEDDMPIRAGQYILPLFMVTETKKSLNSIKIKVIQLHHMAESPLLYKGKNYLFLDLLGLEQIGDGDFNQDGFTDILDLVQIINKIVSGEAFSSQEFNASDINFDGSVNVLDAIQLVNQIIDE